MNAPPATVHRAATSMIGHLDTVTVSAVLILLGSGQFTEAEVARLLDVAVIDVGRIGRNESGLIAMMQDRGVEG